MGGDEKPRICGVFLLGGRYAKSFWRRTAHDQLFTKTFILSGLERQKANNRLFDKSVLSPYAALNHAKS